MKRNNPINILILFRQAATSMSAGILMIIIGTPPQVPIIGCLFSLFSFVVLISAIIQVIPGCQKFTENIKQLSNDLSLAFILISLVAIVRSWDTVTRSVNDPNNIGNSFVSIIQVVSSKGIIVWLFVFAIAFCLVALVDASRTLHQSKKKIGLQQTLYRLVASIFLTLGLYGFATYLFAIGNGISNIILFLLSILLTIAMFVYLRWQSRKFKTKVNSGVLGGEQMIYLFNSAFDPRYQKNLLNTLFLPYGSINLYRYTAKPNQMNVPQEIIDQLDNLEKEEVVISYIDRFGKNADGKNVYNYFPIRHAKLISTKKDNERIYFYVQLLEFVFPKDVPNLSLKMLTCLPGIAKLTNDDPQFRADGYYVVRANNIFLDTDTIDGTDAWAAAVDAIARTKAYIDTAEKHYIFARAEICRKSNPIQAKQINNHNSYLPVIKSESYSLNITYRFPYLREHKEESISLEFGTSPNLSAISDTHFRIDSHNNIAEFNFEIKPESREKHGYIKPNFISSSQGTQLIGADSNLSLETKESISFWVQAIIALVLFALAALFKDIFPDVCSWLKIVFTVVQTAAVAWLWFISGSKLL